jgi:hypothetical protein
MRGWSFPLGRFFGVDVRIHAFFLLLLAVGMGAGSLAGAGGGRVFALWLMLLFAVLVREVARALEQGSLGQTIRVRNENTRDMLDVTVIGAQEARLGDDQGN